MESMTACAAGAGSLAEVINGAIASKPRFDTMKAFFEGVGEGYSAGIWEDVPQKPKPAKIRADLQINGKKTATYDAGMGDV